MLMRKQRIFTVSKLSQY